MSVNSGDQSNYAIPRKLDAPKLFLMFSLDNTMIVLIVLVLFSLLGMALLGVFISYYMSKGYSYLKEEGGKGLLIKFIYWFAPSSWLSRNFPSSDREFFGG